jgi:hypothetical protein
LVRNRSAGLAIQYLDTQQGWRILRRRMMRNEKPYGANQRDVAKTLTNHGSRRSNLHQFRLLRTVRCAAREI